MKLFTIALAACYIALVFGAEADPAAAVVEPNVVSNPTLSSEPNVDSVSIESAVAAESAVQPTADYLPPPAAAAVEPIESAPLTADGYRYRTVRRLKYRRRRAAAISAEYLPPTVAAEPTVEYLPPTAPQVDAVGAETKLADDGYHYKTVRRLRYRVRRRRRDVSELPSLRSGEYLPPPANDVALTAASAPAPAAEVKTVVGNDGYRYRTVRRLRYRYRH